MTNYLEGHWYSFAPSSGSRPNLNRLFGATEQSWKESVGVKKEYVLVNIPDKTEDVYKKQLPVKKYFHPVVEKRSDQNPLDNFFE